jgi:hypothetical protein
MNGIFMGFQLQGDVFGWLFGSPRRVGTLFRVTFPKKMLGLGLQDQVLVPVN